MKPSPPILQLYTPADLPAVVALFTAAVHELAAADYTVDQLTAWAPAEPDWDRWQARLAGSRVWLARLDGQPAGFATLGEIGYLDLLYTHPRFVRRGVATRLLQQAESFGVPASGHYHTHASLTASLSHEGLSHYTMRFDGLDASFTYDPKSPQASKVQATIDAKSLDVGVPKISTQFARDFLAADEKPQITFTSTSIVYSGDHGTMTGDLTLRGVTRPVTLDVTFNGTSAGLIGGRRMGFSASGDIKRSDFVSQAWLSRVGDDVHIVIEAEFQRK